jgi:hypothetical protein
MFSWIARIILIAAGAMAEWFIARDSPRFQLLEICMSLFLIVFIVYVAAFWPASWSRFFDNLRRKSP